MVREWVLALQFSEMSNSGNFKVYCVALTVDSWREGYWRRACVLFGHYPGHSGRVRRKPVGRARASVTAPGEMVPKRMGWRVRAARGFASDREIVVWGRKHWEVKNLWKTPAGMEAWLRQAAHIGEDYWERGSERMDQGRWNMKHKKAHSRM